MPEHGPHIPYLIETVAFLVATVLMVPLAKKLRISPILGFLAIGILLGPDGFGLITDVEGVAAFAELGVVFLLFAIGLELSLDRLIQLRRLVFGLGGLQVLISGLVIGGLAYAWGNDGPTAILIGASLALSSTAIVMQLLTESGRVATREGRTAFSILLFQDLAVVPLLFLVFVFQSDQGGQALLLELALALGRAVLAVVVILVLGRVLLRPLFRVIAALRSPEIFVALTLLSVVGIGYATAQAGLSMALGAFLAGLMLAETEYRHQIEVDIAPFRGLLLGLFFVSVALSLDLAVLQLLWLEVIYSVIGLMVIKALLIFALARLFRLPVIVAVGAGLLLAQGGEFAFVIIGQALGSVVPEKTGQFILFVAAVSMALTPFVAMGATRLRQTMETREHHQTMSPEATDAEGLEDHVVIAGFGRVGRTVAQLLDAKAIPWIALDMNVANLRTARANGLPVFYGDAARTDVLERVHIGDARAFVVTLDNTASSALAVDQAAHHWPHLQLFVRARDLQHARDFEEFANCQAVPETVESSLQLAGKVLETLGTPVDTVPALLEAARQDIYQTDEK